MYIYIYLYVTLHYPYTEERKQIKTILFYKLFIVLQKEAQHKKIKAYLWKKKLIQIQYLNAIWSLTDFIRIWLIDWSDITSVIKKM